MKKINHLLHIISYKEYENFYEKEYFQAKSHPNPTGIKLPYSIERLLLPQKYITGICEEDLTNWNDCEILDQLLNQIESPVVIKIPLNPVRPEHILVRDAFLMSPVYLKSIYGEEIMKAQPGNNVWNHALKEYMESTKPITEYSPDDFVAAEIWTPQEKTFTWKIDIEA